MTAIQRIDRSHSRLAGEVYDRLVEALVQGTVNPGDRLIQDRLAEELDVSRTPVRDALLRLKEEGVIEPSGRRAGSLPRARPPHRAGYRSTGAHSRTGWETA